MDFDERIIAATITGEFVDLRGVAEGKRVRDASGAGIVYRSVRRPAGECVAVFVPRLMRDAQTTGYVGLRWNGREITDAYRKSSLGSPYP
jgi:hypothetical protein